MLILGVYLCVFTGNVTLPTSLSIDSSEDSQQLPASVEKALLTTCVDDVIELSRSSVNLARFKEYAT